MRKIVFIFNFLSAFISLEAQSELWGLTSSGGINNTGVIFKTDSSGNFYSPVYNFSSVNSDGIYPVGTLLSASDGFLYGLTWDGGSDNSGVLYQYDRFNNSLIQKIDFNRVLNGAHANGGLMQASDGMIYGLTSLGGTYDAGVLFQYNPATNIFTKKVDFGISGGLNGMNPDGQLIEFNGLLYGLTTGGGVGGGVLFEYNPVTNIISNKFLFNQQSGIHPNGSLLLASDGKFYGLTEFGGSSTSNNGVLFQYDLANNIYSNLVTFDGVNKGDGPMGSLIQALDGMLYGLTDRGGIYNFGVLFQYDITSNTFTKKVDFDGALLGSNPKGTLFQSSDGNLYGLTTTGGLNNIGTIFKYDFNTNTYNKKIDFNGINGSSPAFSSLIEVNSSVTNFQENKMISNFSFYPNPNNGTFTIESKSKSQITITNLLGEIVLNQLMEKGKQDLSIQSCSDGIYFVNITDDKGIITSKKIIVNK